MNILFLGAYENNGRRYENDSSIGDTGDTASPLIAPLFFSFSFLSAQGTATARSLYFEAGFQQGALTLAEGDQLGSSQPRKVRSLPRKPNIHFQI